MTVQPDRLREAAEALRAAFIYVMQPSDEYVERKMGPLFGEAMVTALAQDGYALALAAPAPDLIAAVEALPRYKPNPLSTPENDEPAMVQALGGRWLSVDDVNLTLLRDAPSREAGLGADDLAEVIRESLDSNNAFEYDDENLGVMTGFEGNKDVMAECLASDLLAGHVVAPRPRLTT